MINKLPWAAFILATLSLFSFFLNFPIQNSGGDIVEYFGMTESLINHKGIDLTSKDFENLKNYLNPGYFVDTGQTDQNGGFLYYMEGKNGDKYPVHFFFYSLLSLPIRLLLRFFGLNELLALRLTNLAILSLTSFIILKVFLKSAFKKIVFITLSLLSPIIQFIIWPGPDIYYMSLLLLAVFLFFEKKYFWACLLTGLASWHSQPLVIIFLFNILFYLKNNGIKPTQLLFLFFITGLPYLLNIYTFGVLTPWTILEDEWTKINGFGLQNASLQKLFEQFFDPNIGLFWYAPGILLVGMFLMAKNVKIAATLLITAFFYQTNPAWNYGTAGFGPTRHILFIIPFLIYYITSLNKNIKNKIILTLIIISQAFSLSINNFLTPVLENSLNQSPYAAFILNHFPQIYNPTPEIFVDRTNHTDFKYISTAVYKFNNQCKKAFVLKSDEDKVIKECGFITDFNLTKDSYVNY